MSQQILQVDQAMLETTLDPDGPQERRGDAERDARRFRPTRSPAPRATSAAGSAAGSARRTVPATTSGT